MFNLKDLFKIGKKGAAKSGVAPKPQGLSLLNLFLRQTLSNTVMRELRPQQPCGGMLKIYFRRSKHARWKDGLLKTK